MLHVNACRSAVVAPCYGLNICIPPWFIYWNLMTNMSIFGGRNFGRWLGHEVGALMNGRDSRELFHLIHTVRTQQRDGHLCTRKQAIIRQQIFQSLHLGLPSPQNGENKFQLFISHLVYDISLIAAWTDWDTLLHMSSHAGLQTKE